MSSGSSKRTYNHIWHFGDCVLLRSRIVHMVYNISAGYYLRTNISTIYFYIIMQCEIYWPMSFLKILIHWIIAQILVECSTRIKKDILFLRKLQSKMGLYVFGGVGFVCAGLARNLISVSRSNDRNERGTKSVTFKSLTGLGFLQ
jgi:hypothetical protein